MAHRCNHLNYIFDVTPSALGCEECLKTGDAWVHLRLCRTCGHVGCCDDSPNRHATKHFHQPDTQLSKAMIRPKDGAGATSTK
jgi:Zn-finger in ubiquitin-hydrolases and other protein